MKYNNLICSVLWVNWLQYISVSRDAHGGWLKIRNDVGRYFFFDSISFFVCFHKKKRTIYPLIKSGQLFRDGAVMKCGSSTVTVLLMCPIKNNECYMFHAIDPHSENRFGCATTKSNYFQYSYLFSFEFRISFKFQIWWIHQTKYEVCQISSTFQSFKMWNRICTDGTVQCEKGTKLLKYGRRHEELLCVCC